MSVSPHTFVDWVGDVCLAGATLGSFYMLIASGLVLRFFADRSCGERSQCPATILVPLYGDEPGLEIRLATLCRQALDAPIQLVCGAQHPDDPAIAVANKVRADFPGVAFDLMVDSRVHGSNPKISNLTNMLEFARHDVLIIIDSDIEIGPDYLPSILGELQQPGVGAVTCPYYGCAASGIWGRLSAMSINVAFLPNVVMALTFGLARPCFGATVALRRDLLNRIGGFRAFADCLADDYALGAAVRAAGYEVAVPALAPAHVCCESSMRDLLLHQVRYARTIRSIDPVGYAGAVITHPLPLAMLALALGSAGALTLTMLALASRLLVCACVERAFGVGRSDYWLLPVRDALSFLVYLGGLLGAQVSWRGYRYRLTSDGSIINDAKV